MLNKIVLGVLLTGMVGALVAGGIIRTNATLDRAEARGEGGYRNGRGGAEVSGGQGQQQRQNAGGQHGSAGGGNGNGGYGTGGQGGNGGYGSGGNGRAEGQVGGGDQLGTGQAQVSEWVTLSGTVLSVNEDEAIVELGDGTRIVIDGRAWSFAQQQGIVLNAGEAVELTGFYEDGEFEVGQIEVMSLQATIALRDENGRPLWAGQGRRGG